MFTICKATQTATGTTFNILGTSETLAEALALCPQMGWGKYEIFAGAPTYHKAATVRISPRIASADVPVEVRKSAALAG